ncbi:hypothetical protein M430DRAFT_35733 [Amorphotheca resinae ATCC 22711]|uniref:Uncharacterized protein n=1 Tax=Amorphotheca resinae ATCC 22711 TaxID=857342 RepID=A0A2T3AXT9_AMORE|nr:hypothetical protein M430DRAFT_35733 [Amorphotheca resinae ATCC 22711]PSS14873.1 hypothetical protein M430DRAFT_35733 [Amorphotheca resinae ATCC 22711]
MTLPSVANVIFEVPTDEPSIYYNPAPPSPDMGVRVVPMTGVRCPTCAANGQEVWVIPGKACPYCGTNC